MAKRAEVGIALEARQAAALLRETANGRELSLRLAAHLDAMADYWHNWMPCDPTTLDRTALEVVRQILAP